MAEEKSKRGMSQASARVAGGQKHDVSYEAGKWDVSPGEVRDAVRKDGPAPDNVEQQIERKK